MKQMTRMMMMRNSLNTELSKIERAKSTEDLDKPSEFFKIKKSNVKKTDRETKLKSEKTVFLIPEEKSKSILPQSLTPQETPISPVQVVPSKIPVSSIKSPVIPSIITPSVEKISSQEDSSSFTPKTPSIETSFLKSISGINAPTDAPSNSNKGSVGSKIDDTSDILINNPNNTSLE